MPHARIADYILGNPFDFGFFKFREDGFHSPTTSISHSALLVNNDGSSSMASIMACLLGQSRYVVTVTFTRIGYPFIAS